MSDKGRPILAAFQFLSRFPISAQLDFTPELLRRSTKYYPFVGAAIAIIVVACSVAVHLLLPSLPSLPAAIIILFGWVWLTGGLHLDGWMDCADALFSYRTREKMLEIMKDSHVGAMGVLACVLLLQFKAALISSVLDRGSYEVLAALIAAPIWSRWFVTWAMKRWPAARKSEGLAVRFHGVTVKDITLSTLLSIVLSGAGMLLVYAIGIAAPGGGTAEFVPLALFYASCPLITFAVGAIAASRMSSRLGGLTGDTYGALIEGLEAVLLLVGLLILQ